MLTFDDSADSAAPPEDVWKLLYDPLRFGDWWCGLDRVTSGDASGGDADVTLWSAAYPDFPLPQRVSTSTVDHHVVVSCTVSDLVFDWRLEPLDPGTRVSVHVQIPEREAARVPQQRDEVSQSLRRLVTLAAVG